MKTVPPAGWPRLRPGRLRLTGRPVVLASAALVALLIPLVAFATATANNWDWWFLESGGAPTPRHAPTIVEDGAWGGHPWQLVAYASSTGDLCFSITPTDSRTQGSGGAMACTPFVGVAGTPATRGRGMTITFLSGAAGEHLPAYIAGPVIAGAEDVEIQFSNGEVLRTPTVLAPESVGSLRFYATPLSARTAPQLPAPSAATGGIPMAHPYPTKLSGLDGDGNVVACLAPRTAVNGVSPLADCR